MFIRAIDTAESPSYFDAIYTGALNQDTAPIDQALILVGIDILNAEQQTAAKKLASEGKTDAVNFLTGKYNACLIQVMQGFAEAANLPAINSLLTRFATQKDLSKKLLASMLKGYARGNHLDLFSNYFLSHSVLAIDENEYDKLQLACLPYLILSSNEKHAHKIHANFSEEMQEHCLEMLAYGHGLTSNGAKIQALLHPSFSAEKSQKILEWGVYGLAQAGHIESLNELMQDKQGELKDALLAEIGRGFARRAFIHNVKIVLDNLSENKRGAFISKTLLVLVNYGYYIHSLTMLSMIKPSERIILFKTLPDLLLKEKRFVDTHKLLELAVTNEEIEAVLTAVVNEHFEHAKITRVQEMLQMASTDFTRITITKLLIEHHAMLGQEQAVLDYCATSQRNEESELYADFRIIGYIIGKHLDSLKSYMDKITDSVTRERVLTRVTTIYSQRKNVESIEHLLELATSEHQLCEMAKLAMTGFSHEKHICAIYFAAIQILEDETLRIDLSVHTLQHYVKAIPVTLMFVYRHASLRVDLPVICKKIIENGGLEQVGTIFNCPLSRLLLRSDELLNILAQFKKPNDFKNVFLVLSGETDINLIEYFLNLMEKDLLKSGFFTSAQESVEKLAAIADERVRHVVATLISKAKKSPAFKTETLLAQVAQLNSLAKDRSENVSSSSEEQSTTREVKEPTTIYKTAFFNTPATVGQVTEKVAAIVVTQAPQL